MGDAASGASGSVLQRFMDRTKLLVEIAGVAAGLAPIITGVVQYARGAQGDSLMIWIALLAVYLAAIITPIVVWRGARAWMLDRENAARRDLAERFHELDNEFQARVFNALNGMGYDTSRFPRKGEEQKR